MTTDTTAIVALPQAAIRACVPPVNGRACAADHVGVCHYSTVMRSRCPRDEASFGYWRRPRVLPASLFAVERPVRSPGTKWCVQIRSLIVGSQAGFAPLGSVSGTLRR